MISIGDNILEDTVGERYHESRSTPLCKENETSRVPRKTNNQLVQMEQRNTLTFNLLRIRHTSEVRVYLFGCCALVEGYESVEEVVAREVVIVAAGKVGEVVAERRAGEFFGEEVDFVEEEDLGKKGM